MSDNYHTNEVKAMRKFKVTLEADLEVQDAGKLDEFKLHVFTQDGKELEISKVQAIEAVPYKIERTTDG